MLARREASIRAGFTFHPSLGIFTKSEEAPKDGPPSSPEAYSIELPIAEEPYKFHWDYVGQRWVHPDEYTGPAQAPYQGVGVPDADSVPPVWDFHLQQWVPPAGFEWVDPTNQFKGTRRS